MTTSREESILTHDEITQIYRDRAKHYDREAALYRLIGFRLPAYRRIAVDALRLNRGDTVVEVGCGTGMNFPLLQGAVGPEGRIIGVDLTDGMLAQARRRIADAAWKNVELVQSDAASYEIPPGVNGVISTLAITLVPEYDAVIARGREALPNGGRFAVFDFKYPERWYVRPLVPLMLLATRPFGVRLAMASRHPWESIRRYFAASTVREFYLGMAYLAVGTRLRAD